jgi:hypothetical protein
MTPSWNNGVGVGSEGEATTKSGRRVIVLKAISLNSEYLSSRTKRIQNTIARAAVSQVIFFGLVMNLLLGGRFSG